MTIRNAAGNFVGHQSRVQEGTKAPDFIAKDQHGTEHRLSDFEGQRLILYFYPKDNTPTCTVQACNLRDGFPHLPPNTRLLGVSADTPASHLKFAQKHQLPFPLLSDPDHQIIKAYDVWGQKMLFGKQVEGIVRSTFITNSRGNIEHIIRGVESKRHMEQILALIA